MYQAEWDELNEKQQESKYMENKLEELMEYLDDLDEPTEHPPFRADIFRQLVHRGIIYRNYDVTLEFKCGITRKVLATRVKKEEE